MARSIRLIFGDSEKKIPGFTNARIGAKMAQLRFGICDWNRWGICTREHMLLGPQLEISHLFQFPSEGN